MSNEDLHQQLAQAIATVCGIDVSTSRPDGRLIEYGLDSVRAVDLLVCLEETFSISIPDEIAPRMRTLQDLAQYVQARLLAA